MSQPSQLLLGISPPQTGQRTLFPGRGGEGARVIDGGKISKQVWRQSSGVSEGKSNLVSDTDKQSRSENSRQQCCLCVPTQRKKKELLYASFLTFPFSSSSKGLWEDRPARVRELNRPRGGSSHFLWHRCTQTHSEMQNTLFLLFLLFYFYTSASIRYRQNRPKTRLRRGASSSSPRVWGATVRLTRRNITRVRAWRPLLKLFTFVYVEC